MVLCFNDNKKNVQEVYDDVLVARVGFFAKIASQALSFSYLFKLRKTIIQFKPDIIHFHAPNPLVSIYLLWLIKRKTKLILHWHSDIVDQKKLYFFYQSIEKRILKRADKIVATSENYSRYSLPLLSYLSKVTIVPNMIDEDKLMLQKSDEIVLESLEKQYEGEKLILFIGRMVPYKGVDYLIDAADKLKGKYKIILIGGGPLEETLKQKAKTNSNILFLGKVSNQALRVYLNLCDIFAFPSITKNEAFGVALAEALYCGLPAVCFDIQGSGVSWVNQNEVTGFVVENKNVNKFAEALDKLLEDDGKRKEMGENATLWASKNFLKKEAVEKVTDVYNNLNWE